MGIFWRGKGSGVIVEEGKEMRQKKYWLRERESIREIKKEKKTDKGRE